VLRGAPLPLLLLLLVPELLLLAAPCHPMLQRGLQQRRLWRQLQGLLPHPGGTLLLLMGLQLYLCRCLPLPAQADVFNKVSITVPETGEAMQQQANYSTHITKGA
jgi:hypothetical protein